MRKTLVSLLKIAGMAALFVSLMSAYYAVISFLERSKYGYGLLFADVEIFSAITIFFAVTGALSLWISYRFKKNPLLENKDKLDK